MKILNVIRSLANGGAEKFVVELSNELAKVHDVKLCSVKPVEAWMLPPKKISPAVKLIELDYEKKYSFILFCKLFRLVKKVRPDVIHVHSSILVFYFYILSIFFKKTLFLQTVHNTITPGYMKLFRFLSILRLANRDFLNVCISQSIFEQYSLAFPRLRFVHIDNGIEKLSVTEKIELTRQEITGFKKDKSTKVFTAIGNYSSFKNFIMLAEAFKELEAAGCNLILLLIGGGRSCDQKNYAEVAGIKVANTFQLGLKDNVADYLGCSDALIMSSTKEGMPLVVLEALSIGLPIVSTPAGGVMDMVEHGVNGVIANGFEKTDMIEAITAFLTLPDRQIREIKENNLKKFAERFSIAQCAHRYIETAYIGH
ncbi:MAG TPA: glycosyltransferase [Bacteroidales bacterium]